MGRMKTGGTWWKSEWLGLVLTVLRSAALFYSSSFLFVNPPLRSSSCLLTQPLFFLLCTISFAHSGAKKQSFDASKTGPL